MQSNVSTNLPSLTIPQSLALSFFIHNLSPSRYLTLLTWLNADNFQPTANEIPTSLINQIISCLPKNSTSMHFYRIHLWSTTIPANTTLKELEQLAGIIGTNQDIRERLTTAFGSSLTPPCLTYTPVRVSSNSKSSAPPTAQNNLLNPQLLSALDTLLAKESRLL